MRAIYGNITARQAGTTTTTTFTWHPWIAGLEPGETSFLEQTQILAAASYRGEKFSLPKSEILDIRDSSLYMEHGLLRIYPAKSKILRMLTVDHRRKLYDWTVRNCTKTNSAINVFTNSYA